MVTPVQWRAVWGSREAGRFLVRYSYPCTVPPPP